MGWAAHYFSVTSETGSTLMTWSRMSNPSSSIFKTSVSTDASQDAALSRLEKENDDLKLCLSGLLRLLVSKNVVTTEELNRFVNLVDPK